MAAIVIVALLPQPAAGAAAPPDSGSPRRAAVAGPTDEIIEAAQRDGTVRVIVSLETDVEPEAALGPAGAARQRTEIARDRSQVLEHLEGTGYEVVHAFDTLPAIALAASPDAVEALLDAPNVAAIEEDRLAAPTLVDSVALVAADAAWAAGADGSGWVVAVLDTGVEASHPFLSGKVIEEACYSANGSCSDGSTSMTGSGSGAACTFAAACAHGTHVAGIAAGAAATHGVAKGAGIMSVQVFSQFTGSVCGSGADPCALSWTSDQVKGLERVYALRGAYKFAAVNMSLGGGSYSSTCDAFFPTLVTAIENLRSAGIPTVISAGNGGSKSRLAAPACISSAVSVGATTKADAVAAYSNSASFLSLLAPGSSIRSSVTGGGYASFSGTSMAAPHVAGAWAVLKQGAPSASVSSVLSALTSTGKSVTDSNGVTKPRIDVHAALSTLQGARQLSVARSGSGVVTSTPSGISCGSSCSAQFPKGQSVTLTAAPSSAATFTGWGGACSGTGSCTVSMSAAKSVTATFQPKHALSVSIEGAGGGVTSKPAGVDCAATCTATFAHGASVTLTASPATGARFAGWSGACSGSDTCQLSMTAARSVAATFEQAVAGLGTDRRLANARDAVAAGVDLSRGTFTDGGAKHVVIGRDDVFADSLAGAALAGAEGPILFTAGGEAAELRPETLAELKRVLGPAGGCSAGPQVFLLGGGKAISAKAEKTIFDLGYCVQRYAGASRVETSVQIARAVLERSGSDQVLLARAGDWADAATGGAYAATVAAPIVVTQSAALHPAVAAFLTEARPREIVLLGGGAALSGEVASAAAAHGSVRRIAGPSRDHTAAAIADQLWGPIGSSGTTLVNGYVEVGWAYALAAAVVSARERAPVVYVSSEVLPAGTEQFLASRSYQFVIAAGPGSLIGDRVYQRARELK